MTLENQDRSGEQASVASRAVKAAAVGAVMALSTAVPAAEPAVSVVETVQLATAPSRTWDAIKDFSAWQGWHPAFATTRMVKGDGRTPGSVRVLTTKDGAQFTEELVAFDAAAHSYQYRIIESPAPVADYVSTIQVQKAAGGSTVVWRSQFNLKPGTTEADAKKLISGVYRAGLDNLAAVTAN